MSAYLFNSSGLQASQTALQGNDGGLGAIAHLQRRQDIVDMELSRAFSDKQRSTNFWITFAND